MRRDHRPYYIKKLDLGLQKLYVRHFIRPQLEHLGTGCLFIKPWHVDLFGSPIAIGSYAMVVATSDKKIRLSIWSHPERSGRITIGDYCLICPGVRLNTADEIHIADNCMLASNVYITDADWHDIYDRVAIGKTSPVRIENNVWIGDSAIVCKGVHIGENSIIGAGAVVVDSIPSNVIAAGNPARVVKALDPQQPLKTRAQFYANPSKLFHDFDRFDQAMLRDNTLLGWLRHLLFPSKED